MKWTMVAALGVSLACGAFAGEHDPIEQRHEMMENTSDALKPLVQMVKGEREFDADTVVESLETMQYTSEHAGALFPPGSDGSDDRSKPAIWTDREGFDAAMADFSAVVEAARKAEPQSVAGLKPVLTDITKACKGCHDDYRFEED